MSTVFCTCTAHITSCEHLLSCVTTVWVRLPGSHLQPLLPLPHSCASPRCAFWLRHPAKQSHPQKELVHGPQFSPQRVDPAPSSTFQLDRMEGEAGCDANDLCVKPRLSLSHCAHAGDFTQFHISFPLLPLFFSFIIIFLLWVRNHLSQFSILSPPKAKWGWKESRRIKEKKSVRNSFYLSRESSRTYCMFTTCLLWIQPLAMMLDAWCVHVWS